MSKEIGHRQREWEKMFTLEKYFLLKYISDLKFGSIEVDVHEGQPVMISRAKKSVKLSTLVRRVGNGSDSRELPEPLES